MGCGARLWLGSGQCTRTPQKRCAVQPAFGQARRGLTRCVLACASCRGLLREHRQNLLAVEPDDSVLVGLGGVHENVRNAPVYQVLKRLSVGLRVLADQPAAVGLFQGNVLLGSALDVARVGSDAYLTPFAKNR